MKSKEERLYEEKCVGCPNEKACHDNCEYCDDFLEELDMMEDD